MSFRTVDPLGPARIDDARDPYRSERLRAQMRSDRAARPQAPPFARIQAARQPAAATATSSRKSVSVRNDVPAVSANPLRDQYTAHCLMNAILAFHDQQARLDARAIAVNQALRDEQATLQARAEAANDLGTIQGLLPQQPYRYATGVPPILAQQLTPAAGGAQVMVGPVTHAAKTRGSTDHVFRTDLANQARLSGAQA